MGQPSRLYVYLFPWGLTSLDTNISQKEMLYSMHKDRMLPFPMLDMNYYNAAGERDRTCHVRQ